MDDEFLIDVFIGHLSRVTDICFTPDCNNLISSSHKGKIIIWDIQTGKIVNEFQAHNDLITSIEISNDGKLLITGSADNTARIWSIPEGKQLRMLDYYKNTVMKILLTANNKFILTQMGGIVKIWDLKSGEFIRNLEGDLDNNCTIITTPNDKYVAGARKQGINIWDFNSGKLEKIIKVEEHRRSVRNLLFSPLGKYLLFSSGSNNNIISIMEFINEKIIRRIEAPRPIKSLSISPDSKYLLGLAGSRIVYLWNFNSGELIRTVELPEDEFIEVLKFSPDEKYIIAGFRNGKINLWAFLEGKSFNYETYLQVKDEIAKRKKKSEIDAVELREEKIQEPEINFEESGKNLVFISYSTIDTEVYRISYIAEKLSSFPEIKDALYWQEDMSNNIIKYMSDNLGKCDAFILFCSPNALKSKPVEKEWTAADAMDIPIIPIFLDVDHIPNLLKSRLGVQFDIFNLNKTINDLYALILKNLEES